MSVVRRFAFLPKLFLALLVSGFLSLSGLGVMGGVGNSFAATDVTSVTASPNPVNPTNGETTTITVLATPATSGLELRVLAADAATVVIAKQQQTPDLKVFADQALTATSLSQIDFATLHEAFTGMIEIPDF